MQFEKNLIYHVFNQGNNRETVFFRDENYLFFLQKMRIHLLPYADLLCYCLMPNHFHWLVRVKETILEIDKGTLLVKPGNIIFESGTGFEESYDDFESSYDSSNPVPDSKIHRYRTLNQSIAILLRSYTRAINKQEDRSGSLFRAHTKAQNGWIDEFITINRYRTGKCDFRAFPDDEYGFHCFEYIHNNPKEAGLCKRPEDWEFSSARDYKGLRKGTLCNQEAARQLLILPG